MKIARYPVAGGHKAFAYVLVMIFLAVFVTLTAISAAAINLSLQSSRNYENAVQARMAAEGGLEFLLHALQDVRLDGSIASGDLPGALASALGGQLNGTAEGAGRTVSVAGANVVVPEISAPKGRFAGTLAWVDARTVSLTVKGRSGGAVHRVRIHLTLVPRQLAILNYGLVSRGQINISGDAKLLGEDCPADASILSATGTHPDAIVLDSNAAVSGDLYASGDGATVAMTGSPTVAGSADSNAIGRHVHVGVGAPDFPQVDVAPIAALATNVLNSGNPADPSYANIRIAAHTNPTFRNDVVLNGVIYVEAPNVVRFCGQTTVNGLIVTQPSDRPLGDCQLIFAGGVKANGVEMLPDTPPFAPVKTLIGTFIAAPGFGLTFLGNFGVVNGLIAADQLTFAGTAEGTVRGSVLGLKDLPTNLGGHAEIYVEREEMDGFPAGFLGALGLRPDPATYLELGRGD
ncbi:MAG: hypothetical protein ABSH10_05695 [Phycisphaerae bacterium]|jgi:hypothetical protein